MTDELKIDDGQLTFELKRGGEAITWTVDLITAKLTAEELERVHDLEQVEGVMIPTSGFLENLAVAYEKLGAEGCTTTAARSIWIVVATKFLKLTDETAEQLEGLLAE